MCPCPGNAKGVSQIFLADVNDPQDLDPVFLGAFEKNMIIEVAYFTQQRKAFLDDNDAVVVEEKGPTNVRVLASDDKVQ